MPCFFELYPHAEVACTRCVSCRALSSDLSEIDGVESDDESALIESRISDLMTHRPAE